MSAPTRFQSGTASMAFWWLTEAGGASTATAAALATAFAPWWRGVSAISTCRFIRHRMSTEMSMPPAATAKAG